MRAASKRRKKWGKGWSWLGVSKQELLARKSTTSVRVSKHHPTCHATLHVPTNSLQSSTTSFLHFCFRFQYHWDSFRYLARPRVYTPSWIAIPLFLLLPLFLYFLPSLSPTLIPPPFSISFLRNINFPFHPLRLHFARRPSLSLPRSAHLFYGLLYLRSLFLLPFFHAHTHTHTRRVNLLFCFRRCDDVAPIPRFLCPPFTFDRS